MINMDIPSDVLSILEKLDDSEKETLLTYINNLLRDVKERDQEIRDLKEEQPSTAMEEDSPSRNDPQCTANNDDSEEPPFPPMYENGEDFDKAGDYKQEAADLKANGDLEAALEKYTLAVLAAPPSALLYANRAMALLQLGRPRAAERDCDAALKENPDSAKALRIRGKARKQLGKYEEALKDISASQAIDFDEGTVDDLKFLTEKHHEIERLEAEKRNKEEERLRKRAEEIKKAQEAAAAESRAARSASSTSATGARGGGMPGGFPGGMPGGFPGGMPGMPNMSDIMSDPEIMEAMQNPKVMAAFQELMSGPGGPMGLMSNPAKLQQLMMDPEVGPVLQKLMSKFAGGGSGGAPSPFGGGAGGSSTSGAVNDDDDDIPDLDDLPDVE